jgi:uncharacterized protein YjbJ (UPF0337 family)
MNEDRIAGTVRNLGGKVQEGVGKVTGNAATEARGLVNQAAGAVQDAYGQAVDVAAEGAATVKQAAVESHDFLKKFVEENPHTATLIAVGVGFFLGYAAHRPPPQRRYFWD